MRPDLNWLADPGVFRVNRKDAGSDHVHYRGKEEAGEGKSSFRLDLSGKWGLVWSPTPGEREPSFHEEGYASERMATVDVPGHVETQGFGQIQYINTMYPWEGREALRPPQVPEDNPVSQYEARFDIPLSMLGQRAYVLRFEGVETAFYCYLNGEFVGYAEDSFTPSEFDVTGFIREKGNRLTVEVYKRSSASWVEDQDFFRFSGIFRPVYLVALPTVHVEDMTVHADFLQDSTGAFGLDLRLSGETGGRIEWKLGDIANGVAEITSDHVSFPIENVGKVTPWSPKEPKLYDLSIDVFTKDGKLSETIPWGVGFTHTEIKGNVAYRNYERIVICGVNRHEWSAETGRAISMAEMEKDISIIKGMGINAVRTCHYPDRVEWYSLCDHAGIMLMAETNLESHGSWQKDGAIEPSWNVPGDDEPWLCAMIDRCESNYHCFKNHPSVFCWSLGNESYCGEVIRKMNDWYKTTDPTRLVHYEGVFHRPGMKGVVSDIESRMYASPEQSAEYMEKDGSKPFLLCEYMHSMGNSCGGFADYDALFEQYPSYMGGFIWDYIDQALWKTDEVTGERYLAYGGDFLEKRTDYEFSCDGVVFADRTEKPCAQEVRHVYQNRLR